MPMKFLFAQDGWIGEWIETQMGIFYFSADR